MAFPFFFFLMISASNAFAITQEKPSCTFTVKGQIKVENRFMKTDMNIYGTTEYLGKYQYFAVPKAKVFLYGSSKILGSLADEDMVKWQETTTDRNGFFELKKTYSAIWNGDDTCSDGTHIKLIVQFDGDTFDVRDTFSYFEKAKFTILDSTIFGKKLSPNATVDFSAFIPGDGFNPYPGQAFTFTDPNNDDEDSKKDDSSYGEHSLASKEGRPTATTFTITAANSKRTASRLWKKWTTTFPVG